MKKCPVQYWKEVLCMQNRNSINRESANNIVYSNFLKRLIAFVFDYIITVFLVTIISLVIWQITKISFLIFFNIDPIGALIIICMQNSIYIIILYFSLFESSKWQATVGKKMVGIKVTDVEGRKINLLKAFIRTGLKLLTVWGFMGFVFMFFTQKKQTLHDILSKTVVCNCKPQ